MGKPLDQLATNVDVVSQLYRLSEGDPLLVRLYVEALLLYGERAAMMTPEQLEAIEPGLSGFFEGWWEEREAQWEQQDRDPLGERDDVLTGVGHHFGHLFNQSTRAVLRLLTDKCPCVRTAPDTASIYDGIGLNVTGKPDLSSGGPGRLLIIQNPYDV
jgi:hypothetical protein